MREARIGGSSLGLGRGQKCRGGEGRLAPVEMILGEEKKPTAQEETMPKA